MTTSRKLRRGFSLVEVMVSSALLGISVVSITVVWGLSRQTTERMRDTTEYYVVARQEIERDQGLSFRDQYLLTTGKFQAMNPNRSDYNEKGQLLATNLGASAGATTGAFYRTVSTFYLIATGSEPAAHQLGAQKVQVLRKGSNGFADAVTVYETTSFSTERADWR